MRRAFVALLGCSLLLAASSVAGGDPLDDLLDGVPASIDAQADDAGQAEDAAPVTTFQDVSLPVDGVPGAQGAAWETPVAQQRLAQPTKSSVPQNQPTSVSMVPEPSAILLAALAMLYFLVFFRRRQYV